MADYARENGKLGSWLCSYAKYYARLFVTLTNNCNIVPIKLVWRTKGGYYCDISVHSSGRMGTTILWSTAELCMHEPLWNLLASMITLTTATCKMTQLHVLVRTCTCYYHNVVDYIQQYHHTVACVTKTATSTSHSWHDTWMCNVGHGLMVPVLYGQLGWECTSFLILVYASRVISGKSNDLCSKILTKARIIIMPKFIPAKSTKGVVE